jgi:hypothetical protein
MATLLQIVQDVCDELALNRPGLVFSSQDQDVRQIQALLQALGHELMLDYEWRKLKKLHTIVTTGAVDYPLPSDFARLVNDTAWDTTSRWPGIGPETSQNWAWLTGQNVAAVPRFRFRLFGNKVQIYPTNVTGSNVSFEYVSNAWILDPDGVTYKKRFSNDLDTIVYDDRLAVTGVKAKYLAAKGLDSSIAQQEFVEQLERLKSADQGAPTLNLAPSHVSPLVNMFNVPDGNW